MGLFGKQAYQRSDSLQRASKAAGKGQRKKAIAEYRKVLEHEPENEMVLTKLGDLLAQTKKTAEAREMFMNAAQGFERRGFSDRAIATYALALSHMPLDLELVGVLADKHLMNGRKAEALKTLLDTRKRLKRKRERPEAIKVLRRALEIEPGHYEGTLDLAGLVAKEGDKAEALSLLEGLAAQHQRGALRRVRRALFNLAPSPRRAWHWLRAAIIGR